MHIFYILVEFLRIPKKPKPPKPTVAKEPSVFLIKQASFDNLQVLKPIQEECATPMFPSKSFPVLPCSLIKFYNGADLKAYEKEWLLTSYERKRRSQKLFVAGYHAHEQLFCPQQASQIEIHFTSSCSTDVILQVQAPNGEFSNYLYPSKDQTVFFNPTKVGCGHGIWRIDIAVRNGCRFRHVRTEEVHLKGQGYCDHLHHDFDVPPRKKISGIIVYNVEPNATIRLKEKLWLNWLN
ncbi:hypothetical protein NECAME_02857 [Necator americanus]|uniref:Uncharacterized protein n=1 Tax=Necator americanus TaxID=51031 RepID=W2TAU5_NECAM|nr:hypothetical protein NECAME_02857 [Necator americanus]ETN78709.1 hypothetical protein NECAME_02857 [Necator americanus]